MKHISQEKIVQVDDWATIVVRGSFRKAAQEFGEQVQAWGWRGVRGGGRGKGGGQGRGRCRGMGG